jgi:hypothetical protein
MPVIPAIWSTVSLWGEMAPNQLWLLLMDHW